MTRRTVMLAVALCTSLAGTAFAQGAQDAKIGEAVKAADAKRFEATTKNDLETLASLLSDDLTYVHSSAVIDTKAAYLDALRSGRTKYHSIETSDVTVRVYGTTAIVNGVAKVKVTANGTELNNALRYTDVWVQRNNKWQMVSWQSTRINQ